MDSDRDNHINTFVRTENKEILIKDKDKWKPFEVTMSLTLAKSRNRKHL